MEVGIIDEEEQEKVELKEDRMELALNLVIERAFRTCNFDYDLMSKTRDLLRKHMRNLVGAQASRSGRYHPSISNDPTFGLLNHIIKVISNAELICDSWGIEGHLRGVIFSGIVLHDLGKVMSQNFTEHAEIGALEVEKAGLPEEVVEIVRYHMGSYGEEWELEKIPIYVLVVSASDMLASEKSIMNMNENFLTLINGRMTTVNEYEYNFSLPRR